VRKVTDFIVNKRYWILGLFIVLSVIAAIVSSNVNINYDISRYLPNTSETRIGMDIMDSEFSNTESSFNLMFKGLTEDKKDVIYNELISVDGVASVDYENNENYNKEDATLYVIHVDDVEDSSLATNVYNEILDKYQDNEIYTSGAIAERNTDVLPMWIMVLAVGCAIIILIIMCESYVEPFLFLITILMAVLLNNGTNIIFDNVSNITSSISAILQMALSMDYSIMLINRYRQEREKESNKVEAMKNALYNAFTSISSSSVTTIVGLIALVFMSFTIGRDLGFVLAKGVLFSLICIFFVLPAFILMFDKLIAKTKKKSPHIKLDKIGKISYKFRYIAVPIFIIIFVVSYLEKGNLNILYTNSEEDAISKIFSENNQIAIIYKNEDEEKIEKHLKEIEETDKVDEVLAYGNTINEELKYDELNDKLSDLGSSVTIEDYLLQILYYKYYNPNEANKMTFNELVTFIQDDVYKNQNMSEKLDDETKENVDRLKNFTSSDLVNKKRNSSEIASILAIDKSQVDDILIYYNSKNNNLRISLNDFIKFMNNDVLTNETYAKKVDNTAKANLNKLSKFTNSNIIQKKMTSSEMANLFGMDNNIMSSLYTYYISVNEIDTKLTLYQFSDFVLNDVLKNSEYANLFNESTINNIKMLNTFSNLNIINKNMGSKELAELLGIEENRVKQLMFLNYSNIDSGRKLSISDFINQVTYIKANTNYLNNVDLSGIEKLSTFAKNPNNINTTKIGKQALSNIFDNVSKGLVSKVYAGANLPEDHLFSPQEFIKFVLDNFSNNMDANTINSLKIVKMVIDDSVSTNPNQYTATELSKMLNINNKQMYNLYALIDLTQNNTGNWTMKPNEFVKLILKNTDNESIKESMNEETLNQLKLLSSIMDSSINKKSYSYKELAEFIGIDLASSKNIYTLYTSHNITLKLTPQQFVNFILNHKNDSTLSSNLDKSTINDLTLVQKVMNGVVKNQKYTSSELSELLGINKNDLDLLYGLYTSKYVNTNQTISLKEFVSFLANDVMKNEEYSRNFDEDSKTKINTVNGVINASINNIKYSKDEIFAILSKLTNNLDKNTVDLLYIYYGSSKDYNNEWTLTVEKFVNYLNEDILNDNRFDDFIDEDMKSNITDAKGTINDAKEMLIGEKYSRIVINTKYDLESEETFNFIQMLKDKLGENIDEVYIIGDSPMAYEMSKTFDNELNFITILTMIAIFVVVAITFKSAIIPAILVLTIQCAVYAIMGILSFASSGVYFIAILIVQSILMGATIDYAILYTSYYIEHRKTMNVKEAIINSYNKSIHTILTSASILIIVTLIVGHFSSAITSMICKTISQGTLCSAILILVLLPAVIAACDKWIIKKNRTTK